MARPALVRRLMLCSSCMQGNLHVQFFGAPLPEAVELPNHYCRN
jgi:hypothetical protein